MSQPNKFPREHHDDVIVFELPIFSDDRGSFRLLYGETPNDMNTNFVQDNFSVSKKNVIRGLHLQTNNPQGKLASCVRGLLTDVSVDLRKDSPTYGKVYQFDLTENRHVFTPPGFAHAVIAREDDSCLFYKCTSEYDPNCQLILNPFCEDLNIDWGVDRKDCIVSEKDLNGLSFSEYDAI